MNSNAAPLMPPVAPLNARLLQMLVDGCKTLQALRTTQPWQAHMDNKFPVLQIGAIRNTSVISRAQSDLEFLNSGWPTSTNADWNLLQMRILKQQQMEIISLASEQQAAIRLKLWQPSESDSTDVESEPNGERQPKHQDQNQSTASSLEGTQSASEVREDLESQQVSVEIQRDSSGGGDVASSFNDKTDAAEGLQDDGPGTDLTLETVLSQALDDTGLQHRCRNQVASPGMNSNSKEQESDQEPARCVLVIRDESNGVVPETSTRTTEEGANNWDTESREKERNGIENNIEWQHGLDAREESDRGLREASPSTSSLCNHPPGHEASQESQEPQPAGQIPTEDSWYDPELEKVLSLALDDICTTLDGLPDQELATITQDQDSIDPLSALYPEPEHQDTYGDLTLLLDAEFVTPRLASPDNSPWLARPLSPAASPSTIRDDAGLFEPSDDEDMDMSSPSEAKGPGARRRCAAREKPLYEAPPGPDGLFHCPWEGDGSCKHKPQKLRCNFHKILDAHLKPFKCELSDCNAEPFSSSACLRRHEREAHALHGHGDKPFQCPHPDCERSLPGNGFPRLWNLNDHVRRVHDMSRTPSKKPTTRKEPRTSTKDRRPARKVAGRKRKRDGLAENGGVRGTEEELRATWDSRLADLRSAVSRIGKPEDGESLKLAGDAQEHLAWMTWVGYKLRKRK